MDSNPICHPSPAKKNAHFWIKLLVSGLKPHLPPLSSQKKIKCLIMFNFWWSAGLGSNRLPPLSSQKNVFGLIQPPGSAHPISPAKKKNSCFWIMFNFWWSAGMVSGLKPHLPPLSSQKNKMLVFGLCSTFDDWPRWSIDLNPVCLPSPVKKIKCLFLDYVQLLMIGHAGQ